MIILASPVASSLRLFEIANFSLLECCITPMSNVDAVVITPYITKPFVETRPSNAGFHIVA